MASRRGCQGAFRLPQVPRIQLPDVAPGALWHVNFSLLDDGGPFAWPRDARAGVLLFWLRELAAPPGAYTDFWDEVVDTRHAPIEVLLVIGKSVLEFSSDSREVIYQNTGHDVSF